MDGRAQANPSPADPATASVDGAAPERRAPRADRPVQGPCRRLSGVDRRTGLDRRVEPTEESDYDGPERRVAERRVDTGLERRRGPGRRLSDERKTAEEGEMNSAQFEFVMAVEAYKKINKRLYPTWTEILEIVRQLGYRKVFKRELKLSNVPESDVTTADDLKDVA